MKILTNIILFYFLSFIFFIQRTHELLYNFTLRLTIIFLYSCLTHIKLQSLVSIFLFRFISSYFCVLAIISFSLNLKQIFFVRLFEVYILVCFLFRVNSLLLNQYLKYFQYHQFFLFYFFQLTFFTFNKHASSHAFTKFYYFRVF